MRLLWRISALLLWQLALKSWLDHDGIGVVLNTSLMACASWWRRSIFTETAIDSYLFQHRLHSIAWQYHHETRPSRALRSVHTTLSITLPASIQTQEGKCSLDQVSGLGVHGRASRGSVEKAGELAGEAGKGQKAYRMHQCL